MTQRKKERYNLRYKAQHKGANNEKKGCEAMNNPTMPKFKKGDRVTYEGLGRDETATVDAVGFVPAVPEPEYTLTVKRGADYVTRWRFEGQLTAIPDPSNKACRVAGSRPTNPPKSSPRAFAKGGAVPFNPFINVRERLANDDLDKVIQVSRDLASEIPYPPPNEEGIPFDAKSMQAFVDAYFKDAGKKWATFVNEQVAGTSPRSVPTRKFMDMITKENTKNIGKPALKLYDKVPKLQIVQNADGDLYTLCDWNELNQFGYHHSNTWQKTVDYARHCGMQDEDLLKVLIRSLLEENLSLKERLQEMIISAESR